MLLLFIDFSYTHTLVVHSKLAPVSLKLWFSDTRYLEAGVKY